MVMGWLNVMVFKENGLYGSNDYVLMSQELFTLIYLGIYTYMVLGCLFIFTG